MKSNRFESELLLLLAGSTAFAGDQGVLAENSATVPPLLVKKASATLGHVKEKVIPEARKILVLLE